MLPRLRIHIPCQFCLPFLYLVLLGLAGQAPCRPTHFPRDSHNGLDRPSLDSNTFEEQEVVRIAQNILLLGDVVRECCTLTLTPTSLPDGQPAVILVKSCTLGDTNDQGGISAGTCGSFATSVGSTPMTSIVSAFGTAATPTVSTTTAVSSDVSVMLSFTSVSALSTTKSAQSTSTPSLSSASFDPSLSSSLPLSSTTTSIPTSTSTISTLASTSPSSPTPLPELSSTITSTTTLPAMTGSVNNAVTSTPQPSPTLPKILGGLAGAAVLLLVIAGTIGYLKQKKMARGEEPIRWPVTS